VLKSCGIDESLTLIAEPNILDVEIAATGVEDVAVTIGTELVSGDNGKDVPPLDIVVASEKPSDS
jgi:hypothetical protein